MALTNPQVIKIAWGRDAPDQVRRYRAAAQPFIYWKQTATGGSWFVVDVDASSDVAVTGPITDYNASQVARNTAAAQFTDDGGLIV